MGAFCRRSRRFCSFQRFWAKSRELQALRLNQMYSKQLRQSNLAQTGPTEVGKIMVKGAVNRLGFILCAWKIALLQN